MDPEVESALEQWREGERRLLAEPDRHVDEAAWELTEELRRRLGGAFALAELAALYNDQNDWALGAASLRVGAPRAAWAVDVAFARYAREAADFGGGVVRAERGRTS